MMTPTNFSQARHPNPNSGRVRGNLESARFHSEAFKRRAFATKGREGGEHQHQSPEQKIKEVQA